MLLTDKQKVFINEHRVARLSTVDDKGRPHVVPVVYAFSGKEIYTPIDGKPKKVSPEKLQRAVNVRQNQSVSLIIDDYSEQWKDLAWLQIRGKAKLITKGDDYKAGAALLMKKYPQYGEMNINISAVIIISPTKILSWQV